MKTKPLVFVDVETTGGSPEYSRIIEIGILRVENGKIKHKFESLVNPQTSIPHEIQLLTGISPLDVETAPTFFDIFEHVDSLLTDGIFVAHNARFDYGFIKSEYARVNKSFSSQHLCTARLSRKLFPRYKHHNLDSLIERFEISCSRRHRAYDDAAALWDFYKKAQKLVKPERFTDAVSQLLHTSGVPTFLTRDILDNLPEAPGVYEFYDKDNAPLYIGKSVNIRERVLSHFSSTLRSERERKLAEQVTHIETTQTTGELSALLAESEMIKTKMPLYNRLLREWHEFIYLTRSEINGYASIEVHTGEITDITQVTAIFKSKRSMKEALLGLAKSHNLCLKLLKLENTKRACFGHQLGSCFGACAGKELPIKYNLRFTEAFSALSGKQWPFATPVYIEEHDPLTRRKTGFVVNHWKILSRITIDEFGDTNKTHYTERFDIDTYKILVSYLLRKQSRISIKPIQPMEQAYEDIYASM